MLDRLVTSITGPDKVWTHWQWYKVFFHIAILRYLVLWFAAVPVLAKLLQKVPHELTIALGDRVITLAMRLPFTWELLWVCSFTYVIALFLYNIVCPRFVKEYSSYAEYKAHMHSPRWIIWQARELVKDNSELPKLVERLKVKRYLHKVTDSSESGKGYSTTDIEVGEKQTSLYFDFRRDRYRLSMPMLDNNGNEDNDATMIADREIFWEVFGRLSSSKKGVRLLVLTLLILSLLLFLVVLVQNIWAGISYVWFR